MPILHAIILGLIQGLTEILPISSSAHLVLVPWVFGWQYQGTSFDVALHLGTAIAIALYFLKDWIEIVLYKRKLLWYIVLATIPAAIAGLLLEEQIDTVFRSPLLIALMLALFAGILWMAERFGNKKKAMEKIDLKSAFSIGLAQALALVPGVSRSGVTITAGLFGGFSREAAARFSFLLATPIVVAAAFYKLSKLQAADLNPAFFTGVVCSFASGIAGIGFLLKFIKRSSLNIFVVYRLCLAALIAVLFLVKR